jgi:hypothetical protein
VFLSQFLHPNSSTRFATLSVWQLALRGVTSGRCASLAGLPFQLSFDGIILVTGVRDESNKNDIAQGHFRKFPLIFYSLLCDAYWRRPLRPVGAFVSGFGTYASAVSMSFAELDGHSLIACAQRAMVPSMKGINRCYGRSLLSMRPLEK